jgi:hypothetical protein
VELTLNCIDVPDPEKKYQPEFSMIQNEVFERKRVHVDNHQYKNCRFLDCTFVYSGGPFGFLDCKLEGEYYLALTGSAHRVRELHTEFVKYDKLRPHPL